MTVPPTAFRVQFFPRPGDLLSHIVPCHTEKADFGKCVPLVLIPAQG